MKNKWNPIGKTSIKREYSCEVELYSYEKESYWKEKINDNFYIHSVIEYHANAENYARRLISDFSKGRYSFDDGGKFYFIQNPIVKKIKIYIDGELYIMANNPLEKLNEKV